MIRTNPYAAILLDLDGTLVDDNDQIHPHTKASLQAASERGIRVVIATGRSELATTSVLEELGLENLAIVYNGAGVYCPKAARLVEERVLSNTTIALTMEYARREELLVVAMRAGKKYSLAPRNEVEASAIRGMRGLQICEPGELPLEHLIRLTLFSLEQDYEALERRVVEFIERPVYTTSFPLTMLPSHRESPMCVVDVHAPCLGKAEALRVVVEHYGIEPSRVVAVGDAMNDVPMLKAAGLGVAMQRSSPDAAAAAARIIGDNNTGAIGELVDELFGTGPVRTGT